MPGTSILICDNENLQLADKFERTILISQTPPHDRRNTENIPLHPYFIKAHTTSREINKELLKQYDLPMNLHLSIMKTTDPVIFECSRIIEIASEFAKKTDVTIATSHNGLIRVFMTLLNINDNRINIVPTVSRPKKNDYMKFTAGCIALLFQSFLVRSRILKNILLTYNDSLSYELAKPYENDCEVIPFFYRGTKCTRNSKTVYKFITLKTLLTGLSDMRADLRHIYGSSLPPEIKSLYSEALPSVELHIMSITSLVDKHKGIRNILGTFDAFSQSDLMTERLNRLGVSTICTPHGVNFRQKVHYISYGVNVHCFWSKDHLQRSEASVLADTFNTRKEITGNILFENIHRKKRICADNKNILVIGEYISGGNGYISPFNGHSTERFFKILAAFADEYPDVSICVRTRLNDEYASIASGYSRRNLKVVEPEQPLADQINDSGLVIAVFSNALHEALILGKKVLQVNLLGIENYRTLADDGLLEYADSEDSFRSALMKWYNGEFKEPDVDFHMEKYCNNAEFTRLNL